MHFIMDQIEPELYEWSTLEYIHINENMQKEHDFIITNLKEDKKKNEKVKKLENENVKFTSLSIEKYIKENSKVIILDQTAPERLSPKDVEWGSVIVCGGILGTDEFEGPVVNRTVEITTKLESIGKEKGIMVVCRHLDSVQMTSDTAFLVALKIIKGTDFDDLEFIDKVTCLCISKSKSNCLIDPLVHVVANFHLVQERKCGNAISIFG